MTFPSDIKAAGSCAVVTLTEGVTAANNIWDAAMFGENDLEQNYEFYFINFFVNVYSTILTIVH